MIFLYQNVEEFQDSVWRTNLILCESPVPAVCAGWLFPGSGPGAQNGSVEMARGFLTRV